MNVSLLEVFFATCFLVACGVVSLLVAKTFFGEDED